MSLWDDFIKHVKDAVPTKHGLDSAGEALLHLPFNIGSMADLVAKPIYEIPSHVREAKDVLTGDFKGAAKEISDRSKQEGPASRGMKALHDMIHVDTAPAKTPTEKYVDAGLSAGPGGVAAQAAEDFLPDTWWKPAAVDAANLAGSIALPELGGRVVKAVRGKADLANLPETLPTHEASISPDDGFIHDHELSLTKGEQPSVRNQAKANDVLAPKDEPPAPPADVVPIRKFDEYDQLDADLAAGKITGDEYDKRARELDAKDMSIPEREQMAALHPEDEVLTPAEKQEMDASAPKPDLSHLESALAPEDLKSSGRPVAAANDANLADALKGHVVRVLNDDSGGLNTDAIHSFAEKLGLVKSKEPRLEDIPDDELTPHQRVILAIRDAIPMEAEQADIYRQGKGEKFANVRKIRASSELTGEEKLAAELAAMKGEYDKVPELSPIGNKISQEDKAALFKEVEDHPLLDLPQSLRAKVALKKILSDHGVVIPTESELELLGRVFPDLVSNIRKRSNASLVADALNTMRSFKTSGDLSAPLRQGLPYIHTKEYWQAFGKMFKMVTEKGYEGAMADIAAMPEFKEMLDHKLSFTDTSSNLTNREEQFMSTLAEKVPGIGHIVRASERTFTGFLNTLRANRYAYLVRTARDAGIKLTGKDLDEIASTINVGTGRGDLNDVPGLRHLTGDWDVNKAAPLVSAGFFAPRFMTARIKMLTQVFKPSFYTKLSPIARTEALKQLMSYTAFNIAFLTAMHEATGAHVSMDPRSYGFGLARLKHTAFGATASISQWIRLAAQEITGQTVDPETGKVTNLASHKYGAPTRMSVARSFFYNKASPPVSELIDFLSGENRLGEKLDIHHPWNDVKRFGEDAVPMIYNDVKGVDQDLGHGAAVLAAPWSFTGGDVNTREPKKKKKSEGGRSMKGLNLNFNSGIGKVDL